MAKGKRRKEPGKPKHEPGIAVEIERVEAEGYWEILYSNGQQLRFGNLLESDPISPAEHAARQRARRARKRARRTGGKIRKARLAQHGVAPATIRRYWRPMHPDWDWHYNVARVNLAERRWQETQKRAAAEKAAPSDGSAKTDTAAPEPAAESESTTPSVAAVPPKRHPTLGRYNEIRTHPYNPAAWRLDDGRG